MNVFFREMKAHRKALIIWCISMFLFVLSGMGKYTAYSAGGNSSDVFAKLPDTMKVLLGIGSFDITAMDGFFAFLFPYIEITIAIHAALLGSTIVAKEERDKTSEFLFAKPISRRAVITSKLFAALLNVIIINLVTLFSSLLMVSAYNKGEDITVEILIFHLIMFFVQLIFLSLGTMISSYVRKPKISGSIATNILLMGYIISKVTELIDSLKILNILSPFKYFSLVRVVNGDGINPIIAALTMIPILVFSFLTYYFYQKRDLNV